MSARFIITGTDTGVGKTIFAAALAQALGAQYWKPVQSGLEEETDSQVVRRLAQVETSPEAYRLRLPASPHISAAAEGARIEPDRLLRTPHTKGPLIIEGAGGVMVPLNEATLFLDVIAKWRAPVVLCARTRLGAINHSLLSLQALRLAGCEVLGVAFIGAPEPQTEQSIVDFGGVRRLGRLPKLPALTGQALQTAFAENFDLQDFRS